MAYAQVNWQHGLTFTGTGKSGFTVGLGASKLVGGNEDGFRPMELLLVGLASCAAMDVISILSKKRQQVTDFQVSATAESAPQHPHVFTHIHLHYTVTGQQIDRQAVTRAIELTETKYCPAYAMLKQAAPIESSFEILEAAEPA